MRRMMNKKNCICKLGISRMLPARRGAAARHDIRRGVARSSIGADSGWRGAARFWPDV